jgi:hypothetical protein
MWIKRQTQFYHSDMNYRFCLWVEILSVTLRGLHVVHEQIWLTRVALLLLALLRCVACDGNGWCVQDDIERMVREAEEFADQDKATREKVEAKNSLEGYLYNLKNQLEDKDKLKDKLSEEDKKTVGDAVKEGLDWLDSNGESDKDDLEAKQKEIEGICNPIISKVYQASGQGGASGNPEDSTKEDEDMPNHDEL